MESSRVRGDGVARQAPLFHLELQVKEQLDQVSGGVLESQVGLALTGDPVQADVGGELVDQLRREVGHLVNRANARSQAATTRAQQGIHLQREVDVRRDERPEPGDHVAIHDQPDHEVQLAVHLRVTGQTGPGVLVLIVTRGTSVTAVDVQLLLLVVKMLLLVKRRRRAAASEGRQTGDPAAAVTAFQQAKVDLLQPLEAGLAVTVSRLLLLAQQVLCVRPDGGCDAGHQEQGHRDQQDESWQTEGRDEEEQHDHEPRGQGGRVHHGATAGLWFALTNVWVAAAAAVMVTRQASAGGSSEGRCWAVVLLVCV